MTFVFDYAPIIKIVLGEGIVNYGGYVVIAILALAAAFFSMALYNRGNIKKLRFTSLGLATLVLVGSVNYLVYPSQDLMISLLVILVLSAVFLWLYNGAIKDENKK